MQPAGIARENYILKDQLTSARHFIGSLASTVFRRKLQSTTRIVVAASKRSQTFENINQTQTPALSPRTQRQATPAYLPSDQAPPLATGWRRSAMSVELIRVRDLRITDSPATTGAQVLPAYVLPRPKRRRGSIYSGV